jgi:phosphate transport system ATP-binding protein
MNPTSHDNSTNGCVLATRGLAVRYGRAGAVRDISLQLARGEITAVIGPSGCGKSSFLYALNRITDLIPGCAATGEILLDGRNIRDPSFDLIALRRRVGMIFQRPNPFPISIRRNIELPLSEHKFGGRRERPAIVERALRQVGLWDEVKDRLNRSALALSGGQQQRLCIARALALEPEVLLLDEPCSSLDPISSRTVEELIRSLRGRTTIVIVTHNLAQARRIADHAAVFWREGEWGELIEFGPACEVFERPSHAKAAAYVRGIEG